MKKKLLAGITKENELYFLEIDTTNDKRNGYNEFSMSGFTVRPLELEEAKEQSRESIKNLVEEETEDISGLYLRDIDEIVNDIIDSDGNLSGLDTSLFPETITLSDGAEYVFESGSCGQHQEKELKHYFIDEKIYHQLMKIWDKYHLKELPENSAMSIVEETKEIKQDLKAEAKRAVELIFNL